ncbi:MAG TPA: hypothetical protein VMO20_04690 [Candidatus Acidoferrum sp.]|nr:hypothetical protein [Candidatus Acidoferrum sp.]
MAFSICEGDAAAACSGVLALSRCAGAAWPTGLDGVPSMPPGGCAAASLLGINPTLSFFAMSGFDSIFDGPGFSDEKKLFFLLANYSEVIHTKNLKIKITK